MPKKSINLLAVFVHFTAILILIYHVWKWMKFRKALNNQVEDNIIGKIGKFARCFHESASIIIIVNITLSPQSLF